MNPSRPILKSTVNSEDIENGLKLEHLVNDNITTMHRLFSSSLRVLTEANIALVRASAPTIDKPSLVRVRNEFSRDIGIIAPHTAKLVQEEGQLPFEDPTFVLAVCNLFVNMTTVVEHATRMQEKDALRSMVDALKGLVDQLPKDKDGEAPIILAGSPEEVASALEKMGLVGTNSGESPVSGANPSTAMADDLGKPPIH